MANPLARKSATNSLKLFVMPTHMVLRPGKNIGDDTYNVILATIDTSSEETMDKNTLLLEVTGTYGFWPFGPTFFLKALWDLLMSFGGQMDVLATNRTNDVAISINNPTFGYPYSVFAETSIGRVDRHNYYADESYQYTDSKGRVYSVTRHEDSEDCKEWTVMVNN